MPQFKKMYQNQPCFYGFVHVARSPFLNGARGSSCKLQPMIFMLGTPQPGVVKRRYSNPIQLGANYLWKSSILLLFFLTKAHRIHVCMVYLPTWMAKIYGKCRYCKYTMTMDPMGCRTEHHRLISWAARVTESLSNSLNSLCLLFLQGKPAHHCWPDPLFII